jgi:hypothetical protein
LPRANNKRRKAVPPGAAFFFYMLHPYTLSSNIIQTLLATLCARRTSRQRRLGGSIAPNTLVLQHISKIALRLKQMA